MAAVFNLVKDFKSPEKQPTVFGLVVPKSPVKMLANLTKAKSFRRKVSSRGKSGSRSSSKTRSRSKSVYMGKTDFNNKAKHGSR